MILEEQLQINLLILFCLFGREKDNESGIIRVYPGKLGITATTELTVLSVTSETSVDDVIRLSIEKFGLQETKPDDYSLMEVILDKEGKQLCP